MTLILKIKDEHFNYFGYQQENLTNLKIAKSEQNPSPVSKTIKPFFFKFKNLFFLKPLTKEASSSGGS